MFLITGTLL